MRHDGTGCINEQHPVLVGLIRVAEEDMSLLFILSHLSSARKRISHFHSTFNRQRRNRLRALNEDRIAEMNV